MITAVLADDEEIVRTSMAKWIPWKDLGISLEAVASDGEEAYELIVKFRPDIVITDLRMPKLDGLELIKRVHSKLKNTEFIILSGFGEFEYAQRAMRYGVKHYMLKPALKEDLVANLKEVKAEIEERKRESGEEIDIAKDRYLFYLQRSMLIEVLSDSASISDVIKRCHRLISFNPEEILTMIVIQVLEADRFVDLILPVIKEQGIRMPVFPIAVGGKVFLTLDISSIAAVERMKSEITSRRGVVVNVLRGTPVELVTVFVQNVSVVSEASIFSDDGRREIVKIHQTHNDLDNPLVERYRAALAGERDPLLIDDIEKAFRAKSIDDAEALFIRMTMRATDYELIFKQLGSVKNTEDLISLARSFIEHKVPRDRDPFPVETIIRYINENFSNPEISLKWISENVVYMNPEYLSRLFQKEIGQRFTDYLNTMRVNEARKLMSVYHQSTVSEIAEKVGYSNPGYFFHIFRRYTGMTPGEYMDKVRKNPAEVENDE